MTKFQGGTIFTGEVMGCQVHAIGKAIRPLFPDLETYMCTGVTIQWTGLLHWNTGLDYWTDIFLVFVHSMVGFIMESC